VVKRLHGHAETAGDRPISFTGVDFLRVAGGKFAEYWIKSDMHVLMAQLRVVA
jgi:predicted ester cyclase